MRHFRSKGKKCQKFKKCQLTEYIDIALSDLVYQLSVFRILPCLFPSLLPNSNVIFYSGRYLSIIPQSLVVNAGKLAFCYEFCIFQSCCFSLWYRTRSPDFEERFHWRFCHGVIWPLLKTASHTWFFKINCSNINRMNLSSSSINTLSQ